MNLSWYHFLSRPSADVPICFVFFTEVRIAASDSAYHGYPELWILGYPAQTPPRRTVVGIRTQDPLVESPTSYPFGPDAPRTKLKNIPR
jgi:hypothetical protein